MSKFFQVLLVLPIALILCCSGLENPFDSKSPNYLSDTTLVRIMQHYDSTFIDTSIVFDTIFHVDTVIRDSIRIINKYHYDTTSVLDTVIYTDHHRDTTIFIDTVIHYDSIGYIDTLRIRETLHFWDTLYHYDTLVHIDTTHFRDTTFLIDTVIHYDSVGYIDTLRIRVWDTLYHYDTLVHIDTSHFRDSVHFRDTIHFHDTTHFKDTIHFRDTTHYKDTIHFRDTLYHYDTVVTHTTVIDTIKFYRTTPFIYLIKLPDSLVFNTFNYGATYSLSIKAAGINPSIIRSYSFMPEGSSIWTSITLPWSRTYNTASPVVYTLRIATDSGTFANSYTLRCNPSSSIRGTTPTFQSVRFRTLTGAPGSFDKKYNSYVPVCTLWTDSAPFSVYPDRVGYLNSFFSFGLPGLSGFDTPVFDFYISPTGSYDTTKCDFYDQRSYGELEYERTDMYPGTNIMSVICRSTSPDTSLWSTWLTMVFIVRDGR
jgi:hypothetical protein